MLNYNFDYIIPLLIIILSVMIFAFFLMIFTLKPGSSRKVFISICLIILLLFMMVGIADKMDITPIFSFRK